MILQSLVSYYDALAERDKAAKPGWAKVKIGWAVEIDREGNLVGLFPTQEESVDRKKMLPMELRLPAPVKKSSGERSNFLWENAEYLLGIPTKEDSSKTRKRFETARELHLSLLAGVDTPEAEAVRSFFEHWDPDAFDRSLFPEGCLDDFQRGSNLTFFYDNRFIADYPSLQKVWQAAYDDIREGDRMIDLVTGEPVVPEKIHPAIKNVRGAQSSGAALVSFNAEAYRSFEREQNLNSPMGKGTAFAYTAALNYLTADKEHKKQVGDMTVVYWAKDTSEAYQDFLAWGLDGEDDTITDADLDALMEKIVRGEPVIFREETLSPESEFYILGISPNAARLAIRFFYRSSFGAVIANLDRHYRDIEVVADHRNKWRKIPLWALLRETVNQKASDKTPSPQLSGDMLRAVMTGGRYPETLLNQTLLRIRAEHDITRGRAAIIKGYLIRNTKNHINYNEIKEAATMALNEETSYTPYVLGRLFSLLEAIQEKANPGISTTIKDRYFNSACATPAAVFPILMKLSNSHLKKLDGKTRVYYGKQLGSLTDKLETDFPKTFSLQEQGSFVLGYYHQTQKRFEKKNENREEN